MFGIILAGGDGTRFSPEGCCKPLLKINGRYLIEYSLDCLAVLGVNEAIVVTGRYGWEIARALGSAWRGISLHYVRQAEPEGLMNAFYTSCADVPEEDAPVIDLAHGRFIDEVCGYKEMPVFVRVG